MTQAFNLGTLANNVSSTGVLAVTNGGTGLTTFTAANNAIYSTSASALAAGTLPVLAGGTGVTTSTGTGSVVLGTRPTLAVTGTGLTLQDATDNTKTGNFVLSGLTTATNYSYTLPAVTGSSLATLGDIAQTFTGATSFLPTTAASTLTIGGTAGTGTITLGQSTVAQTINIANGITATGNTQTINIATAGATGSTTTIGIGSTAGTSTTTFNGTSSFTGATSFLPTTAASTLTIGGTAGTGTITLGQSTATQTVNIANGAVASGQTKQVIIGVNSLSGSTTSITIGSTAGTSTTTLNGSVTFTNAIPSPTLTTPTIISLYGQNSNLVKTPYNSTGLIPGELIYVLNTAWTGLTATTAQSFLGVGVTVAASTIYQFEGLFAMSKTLTATAHNIQIGFGGTATTNNISYGWYGPQSSITSYNDLTNGTTYSGFIQGAGANTVASPGATAVIYKMFLLKGIVSINAGGTLIPQYTTSASVGPYTTALGSYFKLSPLGASGSTNTSIGTWA